MFTFPSRITGGQDFDVDNQLLRFAVTAWLACIYGHLDDVVVFVVVIKGLRITQYT